MTLEPYEIAIEAAMQELEQARAKLNAQISSYPSPISGCDAQFNRLLSDRTRISKALSALSSEPFVATPRVLTPGAVSESR